MSEGFPGDRWPRLLELMEGDGPQAVIDFVQGHDDPLQRRQLYHFAIGAFGREDWSKDMDRLLAVAHAGIDECLRQAAAEADQEQAARRTDLANVFAYNMGANLADCWDDASVKLERRHFEAGLALAERCLAWREELGKGPGPFFMAWWLKGMHQVSLGDAEGAVASLDASLRAAREAATDAGGHTAEPHEDFGIALAEGYLGIAENLAGRDGGKARWDAALAAFARMAGDAEKEDDAEFGAAQLRTVWSRYC